MDQKKEFTLEDQMRGLVEKLDAYIHTYHGGSVEFIGFDDRVVKVRLGGACTGCSLSSSTVHGWIEGTFKQFFPEEVETVEEVK